MSATSGENKYLSEDLGISGLFHNLCGGEPGQSTVFFRLHHELSVDRFAAIAQQADNEEDALVTAIEVVGILLAQASETGELSEHTIRNTGYLIANLAKYADVMRRCKSDARFALTEDGQGLHKALRHSTVDDGYVEIPVIGLRAGSSGEETA